MLLSEHFGGRHYGGLPSRERGVKRGDGRHNRFTRSNVAFQQAVHQRAFCRIFEYFPGGLALGVGERERKKRHEFFYRFHVYFYFGRRRRFYFRARFQKHQLDQEKFVKGEPSFGRARLGDRFGKMRRFERGDERREFQSPDNFGRNRVADARDQRQGVG